VRVAVLVADVAFIGYFGNKAIGYLSVHLILLTHI